MYSTHGWQSPTYSFAVCCYCCSCYCNVIARPHSSYLRYYTSLVFRRPYRARNQTQGSHMQSIQSPWSSLLVSPFNPTFATDLTLYLSAPATSFSEFLKHTKLLPAYVTSFKLVHNLLSALPLHLFGWIFTIQVSVLPVSPRWPVLTVDVMSLSMDSHISLNHHLYNIVNCKVVVLPLN